MLRETRHSQVKRGAMPYRSIVDTAGIMLHVNLAADGAVVFVDVVAAVARRVVESPLPQETVW